MHNLLQVNTEVILPRELIGVQIAQNLILVFFGSRQQSSIPIRIINFLNPRSLCIVHKQTAVAS